MSVHKIKHPAINTTNIYFSDLTDRDKHKKTKTNIVQMQNILLFRHYDG